MWKWVKNLFKKGKKGFKQHLWPRVKEEGKEAIKKVLD